MNETVRDALRQVESAARLYGVQEEEVTAFREVLARQHPGDRGTYACAVLDRVVTEIAYNHRTECDGEDCRTCEGLGEALTVAVASVRSMIADEMTWRRRQNRRWFWSRQHRLDSGLLRDLQDLHMLADLTQTTWTVVLQAARGLRDRDLITIAEECSAETSRQLSWFNTRMKAAAPQALIAAG